MFESPNLRAGQIGRSSATAAFIVVAFTGIAACDDPGGFRNPDESKPAEVAEAVGIADLNGDNVKDIALGYTAVGNEGYTNGFAAAILRDSASASGFRRSVDSELGGSNVPWSVVATDLDGSGADDVAIALGANEIRIYKHDESRNGPLTRATNIHYTGVPFGLAAADLNGDGSVDIAATGTDSSAADAIVLFWQTPPSGEFIKSDVVVPTANNPTGLEIADMNGDGRVDLVASSRATASNGVVSIHLQSETDPGTFLPRREFAAGAAPESLTLADLNGDGLTDVAVVNRVADAATGVMVLLQDPTQRGALLASVPYSSAPWPTAIAAGDLNRDDRIDLVVTHSSEQGGSVSVLLQSSVQIGTFLPATNYSLNCSPRDAAIDDMNDDQLLDIVLACGKRATLLFNIVGVPGSFASGVSVGG